jgi:hypothetical protein
MGLYSIIVVIIRNNTGNPKHGANYWTFIMIYWDLAIKNDGFNGI